MPRRSLVPLTAGCMLALLITRSAQGQTYWQDETAKAAVRIDLLKVFPKEDGAQFLSGALFFSGSGRIGKTLRFEAELPIARTGFDAGSGVSESSVQVGNPYLGLTVRGEGKSVGLQFGVRVPTASDPSTSIGEAANQMGVLADFDRFEAFAPKVFTARAAVEVRHTTPDGLLLRAKLGPSLLVDTHSGNSGDTQELYADYGVRAGYEGADVSATVGFTGRALITEGDLSFAERTVHQVTGALELRLGRVRPSALVRFPLDDDFRALTGVIVGLGVRVGF
jgi:hypothetical protein